MVIMKDILANIAKAIVENPDDVVVSEREENGTVYLELSVNESDMGKVIGKQGRIAKAIRTVMRAGAGKINQKIMVEID